jgi:CubicO group peptidase (beta-lactamase class C family)
MKKTAVGLLIFLVILTLSASAQSLVDNPRLKSALMLLELWTDAQRAYQQIPGVSMAVVYDQTLLWSRGIGYSDLEKKVPSTPQTIYSICSISKLFTSVAVLSLRDQGKLRLDDPVAKHLPWFSIGELYPGFGPATVKGILTHSSGLPRESDFPYWSAPDFAFPTHEQIVERLKGQQTLYPADLHFQYSNLGMTLAGEIVAQLSGQSYADYVTKNILRPLMLADTQPRMPDEHRGGRLATGYSAMTREGKRNRLPFFQANGIAPAAGFSSTVEDLGRFASWQFRLLEKGGTEILNANTLREMHRVQWLEPDWRTAYGLGFAVWQKGEKTFVGHGGSCPGYQSHLLLQPKEKIAVAFAANASGVDAGKFTEIAYAIVAPAVAEARNPEKAQKPLDPSLQPYVGTYSNQPWGGETAIVYYEDGIAAVDFPTDDPLGEMQKLKRIDGNTFRRVRKDGDLGEEVVFEVGSDGKVTRLKWHSNYQVKIK